MLLAVSTNLREVLTTMWNILYNIYVINFVVQPPPMDTVFSEKHLDPFFTT